MAIVDAEPLQLLFGIGVIERPVGQYAVDVERGNADTSGPVVDVLHEFSPQLSALSPTLWRSCVASADS